LQEASAILTLFLNDADLSTDLALIAEAAELRGSIESGAVKPGTKLPLITKHAQPAGTERASSCRSFASTSASRAPPSASPQRLTSDAACQTETTEEVPSKIGSDPMVVASGGARTAASNGSASTAVATSALANTAAATIEPMHRLLALSDPAGAVNVAIELVNNGKNVEAVALLDLLMERHGSKNLGALAARGTARALLRDLDGALEDFNAAIALEPRYPDFYKRRAQALGALGRDEEALSDLMMAAELLPLEDSSGRAETLTDAARIYQKRRDYRRAEATAREALALTPSALPLLSALASSQVSQGDLAAGAETFREVLAAAPGDVEAVLNLGMALKEMSQAKDAAKVLERAAALGQGTVVEVSARRLLAQLYQGLGDHMKAVKQLDAGLCSAKTDAQRIELRFLRGKSLEFSNYLF
jgi:tetratricopeptide (TPR) repeat protein